MTTNDGSAVPPSQRTPADSAFPTGPEIGARFPDFTLPHQRGELVDLHSARGGQPAIVVFERSARW